MLIKQYLFITKGLFRWCSGKESACQCRRCRRRGFDPWVGKMIPWRRKWQPIPVFLPEKFYRQRSLVDYSPWGHKELDTTEHTHTHFIKKPLTAEKRFIAQHSPRQCSGRTGGTEWAQDDVSDAYTWQTLQSSSSFALNHSSTTLSPHLLKDANEDANTLHSFLPLGWARCACSTSRSSWAEQRFPCIMGLLS